MAGKSDTNTGLTGNLTPFLLVLSIVAVNILAAFTMDWVAKKDTAALWLYVAGWTAVIGANGFRFLLWTLVHRRYPLSKSYPLTAIFFPVIALISHFTTIALNPLQWVAVALITVGVVWISVFTSNEAGAG